MTKKIKNARQAMRCKRCVYASRADAQRGIVRVYCPFAGCIFAAEKGKAQRKGEM